MSDVPPPKTASDSSESSRRTFLCRAAGAGAAAVGLTLIAPPLVVLVGAPFADGPFADAPASPPLWLTIGPAERFPVAGPPTRVILKHTQRDAWVARTDVPLGAIYVQQPEAGRFLVHSARCTHLGCGVAWSGEGFTCPCHGATFQRDGTQSAAPDCPAQRPLDTLEWRLADTSLEVRWQRFRLDTPTKVAVG
jgi:Rieske Fe-S protein